MRFSTRHLLLCATVLMGCAGLFLATRGSHAPRPQNPDTAVARPPAAPGPLNFDVLALIEHAAAGRGGEAERDAAKIPADLPVSDFRHLLSFSLGNRPEKLDPPSWEVVVNDTWNALRRQKAPPPEFASELIAFFRNPATPDVLKDYTIQHLGAWISSDLPEGEGEVDPAVRREILSFLVEVSAMRSQSYAGTALYALDRSIGVGGAAEAAIPALGPLKASFVAPLQKAALALLNDPSASTLARISAFQIAMERLDRGALSPARQVASDSSAPPMLRASAIACLGMLGGPSDAALLASIARDCTDTRLLSALRPAMQLLSSTPAPSGS